MGQIIDNINNRINIDAKAMSIVGDESKSLGVLSSNNENEVTNEVTYNKENRKEKVVIDNFEEYIKEKNAKAKEEGKDDVSKEKEQKEAEKELLRNLSTEEISKLKMMGIDIESANLKDLLGQINTMRGNAHRDELAKLMAKISVDEEDISKLVVSGNGVSAGNNVAIESIDVSDVIAAKADNEGNKIVLSKSDNEENKENKVVLSKSDNKENKVIISKSDILQVIKNNYPISKDGIYKAHYNGGVINEAIDNQALYEKISSQINNIIEQAGYQVNEKTIGIAKDFVANNIPVTTENIDKYMKLFNAVDKELEAIDLLELNSINNNIEEKAKKIYEEVKHIDSDVAVYLTKHNKALSIAAVSNFAKNSLSEDIKNEIKQYYFTNNMEQDLSADDLKAVTAKRQMEEIRLSMTFEAAIKLVKKDFYIDTRELSKVVNNLKSIEEEQLKNAFNNAGVERTKENVEAYRTTSLEIELLARNHAGVIAAPIMDEDFTVNSLNAFSKNFAAVEKSYEAVGTAPRYDMGDSINKAFNNIEDILSEMNIEANQENVRATRILGYNQLEITEENITKIVSYDRQVNDLINNFYPEAVLGLIKDGVNPLDMDISSLNAYINERKYNKGVSEAKDFAAYLRSVEKQGDISKEERESYIGIFRMMNKLAKSGDREAGWLFANEERLTVRNLLGAMRSRRAAGIDISVDDEFGALTDVEIKKPRIDDQIESAFSKINEELEQVIKENNIEESILNYNVLDKMFNTTEGIHPLISKLVEHMHVNKLVKDEILDEETENMSLSMSGKKIDINPEAMLELEGIANTFMDMAEEKINSDDLGRLFDNLNEMITNGMYGLAEEGNSADSFDIRDIKMVCAGLNILKNMTKHNNYQIPVDTENGVRIMNVKLQSGEEAGRVEINIKEIFGGVSADIKLVGNRLEGYIVCETSEGNDWLSRLINEKNIDKTIDGFDISNLSFGQKIITSKKTVNQNSINKNTTSEKSTNDKDINEKTINEKAASSEEISNKALYKAAATIVKMLGDNLSA